MDEKKKLKELATLHKIYYGNDYEITPSESPDFLVYKKSDQSYAGVELTQLYLSQARAKIFNRPEQYAEDIKSEYTEDNFLKIYTRNMEEDDWLKFSTDELLSNIPNFMEYKSKIISIIEAKSQKSIHYNPEVDYLELLIEDCEKYFKYVDVRFFKLLSESNDLKKTIMDSRFVRIYILSEYNDQELLMILEGNNED